jgi:hypothetical protein
LEDAFLLTINRPGTQETTKQDGGNDVKFDNLQLVMAEFKEVGKFIFQSPLQSHILL